MNYFSFSIDNAAGRSYLLSFHFESLLFTRANIPIMTASRPGLERRILAAVDATPSRIPVVLGDFRTGRTQLLYRLRDRLGRTSCQHIDLERSATTPERFHQAITSASPFRVLRSVVMPEAWPALMAGGSLVLLLTLNEFGIVLFTGAKGVITLPVLIYTRGIVTFDLPGAAVIATVQIVLSLVLYSVYRWIFARVMSGRGKGESDVVVEQTK